MTGEKLALPATRQSKSSQQRVRSLFPQTVIRLLSRRGAPVAAVEEHKLDLEALEAEEDTLLL